MRILLVEDDDMLGRATRDGLVRHFAVDWFRTLADASAAVRDVPYGLVILDLTLPDGSGIELLSAMRQAHNVTPVLILTARDAVKHRIDGLNAGGDDYLVKPFDLDELVARCRALLRRSQGLVGTTVSYGDLVYNTSGRTITFKGAPVNLSGRELAILECLIAHHGQIVSRSQIEHALYDFKNDIESNAVEVHISAIRHKTAKTMIRTVRGIGYQLTTTP